MLKQSTWFISKINKYSIIAGVIIVSCFLLVLLCTFLFSGILQAADNRVNDQLFRLKYAIKGRAAPEPALVSVGIDDSAYDKLALTVRDRRIYAELISTLNQAGAKTIGCDILFEDTYIQGDDASLVQATRDAANVYYPVILKHAPYAPNILEEREQIPPDNLWHPDVASWGRIPAFDSALTPFPALGTAARGLGHISCSPDPDGINRRYPLFYKYNNGYIPSLALALVCDLLRVQDDQVEIHAGRYIRLKNAALTGAYKTDIRIPVDDQCRMIIGFPAPWEDNPFFFIPAHKAADAKHDEESLAQLRQVVQNSLVLISDISVHSKDFGTTVFDKTFPLSYIHLAVADSIMSGRFMQYPVFAEQVITCMLIMIFLWIITIHLRSLPFFFSACSLFVLYIVHHAAGFVFLNRLTCMTPVIAGFILAFIAASTFRLFIKERELILKQFTEREIGNLRSVIKSKNNLLQVLTHEIKQPVTVIQGFLELIRNKQYGRKIDAHDSVFKKLADKCTLVLTMIKRLYDFVLADIGKLKLDQQDMDILMLLKSYIPEITTLAALKNINAHFRNNLDQRVVCAIDKYYFESAFFNIVSNAVKFTPQGGALFLSMDKAEAGIAIRIRDTGCGIEPEKAAHIFELNYQVEHSTMPRQQGLGIGLYFTREVILKHAGAITVQSTPGTGTTFTITLPVRTVANNRQLPGDKEPPIPMLPAANAPEASELNYEASRKTILVIDDNAGMRELYVSMLKDKYNLLLAANGLEAFALLETASRPDLIILDLIMPDMDGKEFFTRFMENKEHHIIPVIFVTGSSPPADGRAFIESGALDYICKPFTCEGLLLKIESIIRMQRVLEKHYLYKIGKLLNLQTGKTAVEIPDAVTLAIMQNYKQYNISDSERRVLEILKTGAQDKEIGDLLCLSERTVHHHVANMREKVHAQNRVELVYKIFLEF